MTAKKAQKNRRNYLFVNKIIYIICVIKKQNTQHEHAAFVIYVHER